MDETRRQKFITTYGFDPMSIPKPVTPKQGAVGGTPSFTKEQMDTLMGTSKSPVSFTKDQVDFIDSNGGINAFRGSVNKSETVSDYKPGKFVQSLEDFRPDYSGGILKDISEGLGDVGVGVLKAGVRMPVNILQALTPDKMWGENSLLNSESERARAFESATKGKTGLQKLGATGTDIASLFTPVGIEKGGATLAGLAGKGALAGTERLLAGNTGMLAKVARKVAPSIAETVAGSAMLGSDESFPTDVGIAVVAPYVPKILNSVKSIKLSPGVKASISELTGSTPMMDSALDDAINLVNTKAPIVEKTIKSGRDIMASLIKPSQVGNMFGSRNRLSTKAAMDRFNEVTDVIMHSYLPEVGQNKRLDWTAAASKLASDENMAKAGLDAAEKLIGNVPVQTGVIMKDARAKLGAMFQKKYGPVVNKALGNAQRVFDEYLNTSKIGTKQSRAQGVLPLTSVDGVKQSLWALSQDAKTQAEKKVYAALSESIDTSNALAAKNAGYSDVFKQYLAEKGNYSFLQDVTKVMNKLRDSKNPFTTSQVTDHLIGLSAGGVLNNASGRGSIGAMAYYTGRLLSKLLGSKYGEYKVKSLASDSIRKVLRTQREEAIQSGRNKLSEIINKQSKK